ncbi:hypothetical protein LCGC14_2296910 [marine sediment metagenome]|uniref:Uncharacterized protein n=1 Tax=marine sediment metagenome TaxID=412755 RepID=A0A0F9FJS1_9ZZZZ
MEEEISTCRHIERYMKNRKEYCVDCGMLLLNLIVHGNEVEANRYGSKSGTTIKSRSKKDNMWMSKK